MALAILILSIALQFWAAALAFRLLVKTGRIRAWLCIAAALLLMGVRRLVSLVQILASDAAIDPFAESVALLISVLMLAGVWSIGRVFERLSLIHQMQQMAEDELQRRKQAEAEIRSSEESLRQANLVLESSPAVLFRWKAAEGWPVTMVSRNVVQFGYAAEELLSGAVPFASMVHPEDLDRVAREVQEHSARGTYRFQQEYRIVTKDGAVRWVDDRTVVEREADGRIAFYQGIVMDITERAQVEEALIKSETLLRKSQEIGRIGSWERDLLANRLIWSDEVYRIFGVLPEDFTPSVESFFQAVHPDDREAVNAVYTESIREGRDIFEIEHRLIRGDNGETRFVLEKCEHVKDASGAIVRSVGMVQDITERRRAEAALCESEEKYRRLIETTGTGFVILDDQGRVLDANREYLRLTGRREPEDVLAQSVLEWTAPHDHDRNAAEVARCVEQGFVRNLEIDYLTPAGEIVPVEINATVVHTPKGLQILTLCHDITNRRHAEAALRESEERFRSLVETTSDWIWEVDAEGRYVFVSDKVRDLLGYAPEEIIGRRPFDLMPASEARRVEGQFSDIVARRVPFAALENTNLHKNGRLVVLESSGVPLFGPGGELRGYRGMDRNITEQKATREQIEFLAYHDPLTQLPNRLLGKDRIHQAISYAHRYGCRTVVLFLDLDNFKLINDTYGHATGDALLQAVAKRLERCVREEDSVCRLSGDEFLIVLNNIRDNNAIASICEKIMRRVEEPFEYDGGQLSTSVSIGASVYPDDSRDVETMLRNADTALYEAKKAGRKTYRFFEMRMNIEMVGYVQRRAALQSALQRSEFTLRYQPMIHLRTGKMTGAEALIRWNHPELGLQYPRDFMAAAEDSGLILPIGEWVLREACRQAMKWRASGLFLDLVTVNLSPVQFQRTKVDDLVIDVLRETGLPPTCLGLELTESMLIQDVEHVLSTLHRLKSQGITLSIDDFGTGYSSLSYLKRFSVDTLKINQAFVSDIVHDAEGRAVLKVMIQIARILNLKTVAEGVERDDVRTMLLELGCDEAQGYYFSEPLAVEAFEAYWQKLECTP